MHKTNQINYFLAFLILLLSSVAFLVNHFITQYQGNNYFPHGTIFMAIILLLIYAEVYLLFGQNSPFIKIVKEMIYFFFIMVIITIATNAAQYSPFPPIDKQIVTLEAAWHIHLKPILNWTHDHPMLNHYLWLAYDSLPFLMGYFPLFVILMRRFSIMREYYFLLLCTTLLGFTFYYFFPTTAPASIIDSPYFLDEQRATYLKFFQIHHHIPTTTNDGGMIAFPSFHVIWAWLCLYITRFLPFLFIMVLPVTLMIIVSCVLLGWHYLTDVLGAFIVLVIAHGLHFFTIGLYRNRSTS